MSRQRAIALISVREPIEAAETVANALHSRLNAARFLRDAADYLDPPKSSGSEDLIGGVR